MDGGAWCHIESETFFPDSLFPFVLYNPPTHTHPMSSSSVRVIPLVILDTVVVEAGLRGGLSLPLLGSHCIALTSSQFMN